MKGIADSANAHATDRGFMAIEARSDPRHQAIASSTAGGEYHVAKGEQNRRNLLHRHFIKK